MPVEHEYERGAALRYLGAYDVRQACLFGTNRASHGDRAIRTSGRTGHDGRARSRLRPPSAGINKLPRPTTRSTSWV